MKKQWYILTLLFFPCFTQAQNVGIGTTTPQSTAKLHIDLGTSLTEGFLVTGFYSAFGTKTVPDLGAGSRLMYYPGKAAFRAGNVSGTQWDDNNTGLFSFAGGLSTTASGNGSTAFGANCKAIGVYSFSSGQTNEASGLSTTALGDHTMSAGWASLTSGYFTKASGWYSTAFGNSSIAKGYASTVLGVYNDSLITGPDQTSILPTTPLFIVGNGEGTLTGQRHNAMVVYKNGNMVLKNPTTVTTVPGGFTVPISGAGTRMMWLPEKSAFRVGTVSDTEWDATNIGLWSFASGFSSQASGGASVAFGNLTKAIGAVSTALGEGTSATGTVSTAMGANTNASGSWSTAMGLFTNASGNASTALGDHTVANAYASVVIGQYDSTFTSSNSITWVATDPLLILGNGTNITRSNALLVLKNGNTGIGTNTPGTNKLDVNGNTQTDSLQVGSGTKFSKMQAGTFLAGGGAAQLKVVTIFFPSAFSTIPKITVTPRNEAGTNNNDVYAVTVRSITATGVVINILRVDVAAGWGQNLQLDWQAWTQ
jgi:hypothetical protein